MADIQDTLDSLTGRLRKAVVATPQWHPWVEQDRDEVVRMARECLGVRDELIPTVRSEVVGEARRGDVTVQLLRATTWDRCYGAAHLFLPAGAHRSPLPLVILCCGHGSGCKRALGYQAMAWRLAHAGAAVLVPDNIGQGEREPMGHRDVVGPFQCGLSVQGLIVTETAGWLGWAQADGRFDRSRIAAIGNSGGGLLTLFLGAIFRDDFAAVSSSGYPCAFDFIARKEKNICHCNILPGVVGSIEMWQLYGCIAPKPLLLFQGAFDHLFPADIFDFVSRKVHDAYRHGGAGAACQSAVFPDGHSWDDARREALAAWLAERLELDTDRAEPPALDEPFGECYDAWPAEALTTDALACQVSGIDAAPLDALFQWYLPHLEDTADAAFRRVTGRQLAAQFQAFLAPRWRLEA